MTTKIPAELSSTPSISDSGDATAITIGSNEKVGIGTTSTDHQLSVNAADFDGIQLLQGGTDTGYIGVYHDGSSTGRIYLGGLSSVDIQTGNGGVTDGTTRVRVDSDGLKFGTDTAAANALDDYEEGTWTVSDGSGAGLSFTVDKNRYTKIGRFVMAHTRVTYPSTSDSSTATVALPFTPSSNCIGSVTGGICTEQDFNTGVAVTASIDSTAGTRFRSNGGGALTNAQLSGKTVRFTVTFII